MPVEAPAAMFLLPVNPPGKADGPATRDEAPDTWLQPSPARAVANELADEKPLPDSPSFFLCDTAFNIKINE